MRAGRRSIQEDYLRALMFGLQDGIVSTTGVVIGISTGVSDKSIILMAALVAVTVEATSMAAGQYSSEKAVHQMDRSGRHTDSLAIGALLMFAAYLFGGAFSVVPTIALAQPAARYLAVVSSFVGLFGIGYIKGRVVGGRPLRSAVELFAIGGIATLAGVAVGRVLAV